MLGTKPRLILYFPNSNASLDVGNNPEVVAGLSDLCDINLRRFFSSSHIQTISRLHFKLIHVEDAGYAIVDLFSTNGTRVNDRLLQGGVPSFLRTGDYVTLANREEFVISVATDVSSATAVFEDVTPSGMYFPTSRAETGLRYIHSMDRFVVDDMPVSRAQLTQLEYALLRYLCNCAGRICSYDELATRVWRYKPYDASQNNSIAKTVSNLRRKLDSLSVGSGEKYIVTVHGRGVKCLLIPE